MLSNKYRTLLMCTVLLLVLWGCTSQENMTADQVILKSVEKLESIKSYAMDIKMEKSGKSQPLDRSQVLLGTENKMELTRVYSSDPIQIKTEGNVHISSFNSKYNLPLLYYASVDKDALTTYTCGYYRGSGDVQGPDLEKWYRFAEPYHSGKADLLKNYVTLFHDQADRVTLEGTNESIDGKNTYCLRLDVVEKEQKAAVLLITSVERGLSTNFYSPIPDQPGTLDLIVLLYVDRKSFEPIRTVVKQRESIGESFDKREDTDYGRASFQSIKVNLVANYYDLNRVKGDLIPTDIKEKAISAEYEVDNPIKY